MFSTKERISHDLVLNGRSRQGARARALYKSGFRTVRAVAEATIPELAKALESSAWAAQGGDLGFQCWGSP